MRRIPAKGRFVAHVKVGNIRFRADQRHSLDIAVVWQAT